MGSTTPRRISRGLSLLQEALADITAFSECFLEQVAETIFAVATDQTKMGPSEEEQSSRRYSVVERGRSG